MTIKEILESDVLSVEQKIASLKAKTINIPVWDGEKGLVMEYEPKNHPVMNKATYPDVVDDGGHLIKVSRVTTNLQKLAVKRMGELVCGIPVKRVYRPTNAKQKTIATLIESIYDKNRIDSVNIERCRKLYASCEVMTLWYAVEQPTMYGDTPSKIKIRCKNYSPMDGHKLYPLFDEYDDMVAMSVEYNRQVGKKLVCYFDTYTDDRHVKYSNANGTWEVVEDEPIKLGKIPAIYMYRPTPIWEDTSNIVYEIEWAFSRNGNYLRENGKPLFALFADDYVKFGDSKGVDKSFKDIMSFPKGSDAKFITWEQAVENLKYQTTELRSLFFTQLQLPDWSYEKMSQQALSGESRKQMFIDAQLKVKDESGILLEGFDRELNVIKSFVKFILGEEYAKDIDALKIETKITPFTITDESDRIKDLTAANGGEPIMSQRESIEEFGHSDDVDRTLREIEEQRRLDVLQPEVYN